MLACFQYRKGKRLNNLQKGVSFAFVFFSLVFILRGVNMFMIWGGVVITIGGHSSKGFPAFVGLAAGLLEIAIFFPVFFELKEPKPKHPVDPCEKILMHGLLRATICEIDKFQRPSNIFSRFMQETLCFGKSKPKLYATIQIGKFRVGRTRINESQLAPLWWFQTFDTYCAHEASNVSFTIVDDSTLIGTATIPVHEFIAEEEVDKWLDILNDDMTPISHGSKLHIKLQFLDATRDPNELGALACSKGPYIYKGCRVSLYQDAHMHDNFMPGVILDRGTFYEPHRCWEDVFDAIAKAKHFIYITGWSVNAEITLIRDSRRPKPGSDIMLGELLKQKANECVKVLILVWDDRTSVAPLKRFFQGTSVGVLCPSDDGASVQDSQSCTMFAHHQKIIVVDSEMTTTEIESTRDLRTTWGSERRRIVSFVGGIDLCEGRYDTPFHSLFRTLDTAHDDFHQPNFIGASITKGGPREPWHDIHSRLEGPVCWEALASFEQIWSKYGEKDELVKLDEIIIPPAPATLSDDHETWNVQLSRSIDGGAAFDFLDKSIENAYIRAIRVAKNFIYLETEHFLGSYEDVEEIGTLNLIPREISLKIASKIKAEELFTVYVVIPMWPEGIPESASVQAALDWQRRTIQMMYKDVIQALRAKNSDEDPRNYLTFFCLGNREVKKSGENQPSEQPEFDSDYIRAQET